MSANIVKSNTIAEREARADLVASVDKTDWVYTATLILGNTHIDDDEYLVNGQRVRLVYQFDYMLPKAVNKQMMEKLRKLYEPGTTTAGQETKFKAQWKFEVHKYATYEQALAVEKREAALKQSFEDMKYKADRVVDFNENKILGSNDDPNANNIVFDDGSIEVESFSTGPAPIDLN